MKQIIAMGGGGFLMDENSYLDDFILSRAKGAESRVCFVATAAGDSDRMLVSFYTALGPRCRASHLPLFRRQHADVAAFLLDHDVIYVGGGNSANMLSIWRVHGVHTALAQAYDAGILLCGLSAGGLCWFETGVTDSFGPLAPLENALGLLPGSFCPAYGDLGRRATYQRLVRKGMPSGYGHLAEVVTSRPQAGAYRLERRGADEERIPGRYLGAPA